MRRCFVRRAVPYSCKDCKLSSLSPIVESSWANSSRRWRKYYIGAAGNYLHNGTTEQRRGSESSVQTPLWPCQEPDLENTDCAPGSAPTELPWLLYGCLCSSRLCQVYTGLFISPSGISELDCAITKTDTAERSISIGRKSLQVFFCTRGLGVLPGSTARG